MRPRSLRMMPPVEVAAARCPSPSIATAPIVSPAACHCDSRFSVTCQLGIHALDALAVRDRLGAGPREQHVGRLLHHDAREHDRVAHSAHGGHAAHGAGAPAHDRGVVLGLAALVQHRAAARVEERIVLERDRRRLHRVERRAARLEHPPPGLGGRPQPLVVGRLVANRAARPAVDD